MSKPLRLQRNLVKLRAVAGCQHGRWEGGEPPPTHLRQAQDGQLEIKDGCVGVALVRWVNDLNSSQVDERR